jgi:hypothetical protein
MDVKKRDQHPPLRIPKDWKDQERAFVIQLEQLIDQLYKRIGELERKVEGE